MSDNAFFSEREITVACNSSCECGGRGMDNDPCPACEVWHKTAGNKNHQAIQHCGHPAHYIISTVGEYHCLMCDFQAAGQEITRLRDVLQTIAFPRRGAV